MTRHVIGTIVPSSNRTVERTLAAIMPAFPQVDSCIARIPYWGNGLGQPSDGYEADSYRDAARLLGHAGADVVCWNGSKGAALGLATDAALAALMAEAAGCTATTTVLATATLLARLGIRRIAIIAQGSAEDAAAHGRGFLVETTATCGLNIRDNREAGAIPPQKLATLVREVAPAADAVLIWSTNLPGYLVAAGLEAELDVPILDSASVGVWACLTALGLDPSPAAAFGRIFTVTG
jgi:maleate isomerase